MGKNDNRVETVDAVITLDHVIDGHILLRAGKKRYHRVDVMRDPGCGGAGADYGRGESCGTSSCIAMW